MAESSVDEGQRQRALDALHIVGSLPEPEYDDIVTVAAAVCGTPMALVSLIDRDRQWFKARSGVEGRQSERNLAVCDHAIRQPTQLMEVDDLAADTRFADNPLIKDLGARFYAGMPLVTEQGAAIGSLCVIDVAPRALDAAQREALKALARVTMSLMENRSRQRRQEVAAIIDHGTPAQPTDEPGNRRTIVLLEIQDLAELSERLGERVLDRKLQQLDQTLEACMTADHGDSINRVTGSGEFVAVLHGDDVTGTLSMLEKAAADASSLLGSPLLIGTTTTSGKEPIHTAFLRAEAALSAAKDAARK